MTTPTLVSIAESRGTGTSIKDAYCDWLRDVDVLTRKRKSKKKSKRLAALRHLTQATESSTNKCFKTPVPDGTQATTGKSEQDMQQEAQRRRFRTLADEASYDHFSYEPPLVPGLGFFELLAGQSVSCVPGKPLRNGNSHIARREIPHFPVQVPPTVLRESRGVVVFFTVEQQSEPQDNANDKSRRKLGASASNEISAASTVDWMLQFHFFGSREVFESQLPWILRVLSTNGSESNTTVLAVLKIASDRSNHVQALASVSSIQEALLSLWEEENSFRWKAVQTYVPSKGSAGFGSGNAWIARPAYRKKDQSATTVWILTGSDSQFATTEWNTVERASPPCQIVKCTTAQSWQQPRVIVETVCQYLDTLLRPTGVGAFAELVVDLVQDPQGGWWLLQVKAFQIRRTQLPPAIGRDISRAKSAPDRLETQSIVSITSKISSIVTKAKWKCAGKYCHDETFFQEDNQMPLDEPSGYLTKKELLSCEFYDRFQASDDASLFGGYSNFSSALQFYLQHQLSKRDRTVLYEPQALCGSCIQRYYTLRTGMTSLVDSDGGHQTKKSLPTRTSRVVPSKSLPTLPVTTKLPPLQPLPSQLHASQSVPQIPISSPPSYMDELERIEQLLASESQHHTPPTSPAKDKKEAAQTSPTEQSPTTKSTFSWLNKTSQRDRVEEMWQSIQLKPLAHLSNNQNGSTIVSPSHAYNTFSLQAALRELSSTPPVAQQIVSQSIDPHLISLVDCRRVFSDEAFRQSLVCETTERLLVHKQPVQFVVLLDDGSGGEVEQDLTLGRLALRTLALDIDQVLAQEGVAVVGGFPFINGQADNSGCLFMTVPVPQV